MHDFIVSKFIFSPEKLLVQCVIGHCGQLSQIKLFLPLYGKAVNRGTVKKTHVYRQKIKYLWKNMTCLFNQLVIDMMKLVSSLDHFIQTPEMYTTNQVMLISKFLIKLRERKSHLDNILMNCNHVVIFLFHVSNLQNKNKSMGYHTFHERSLIPRQFAWVT